MGDTGLRGERLDVTDVGLKLPQILEEVPLTTVRRMLREPRHPEPRRAHRAPGRVVSSRHPNHVQPVFGKAGVAQSRASRLSPSTRIRVLVLAPPRRPRPDPDGVGHLERLARGQEAGQSH